MRQTRRTLLRVMGASGVAAVAGCLGSSQEAPEPVDLDQGQTCDTCNMRIEMHPGPVGQSYYMDDAPPVLPDDRPDGVAWFCSTQCQYSFTLEQAERDYEPLISYATDYSDFEWELREQQGATVISANLSAETQVDLRELTLVVNSDIEGAMGPSLIGFSDAADAEAFADEHGGDLFQHEDVTLDVIAALSM